MRLKTRGCAALFQVPFGHLNNSLETASSFKPMALININVETDEASACLTFELPAAP